MRLRGRNGGDKGGEGQVGHGAMAEYRLYRLDKDGHVLGPPEIITGDDDEAAIATAHQYVDGVAVELWDRSRRVAFFPAME